MTLNNTSSVDEWNLFSKAAANWKLTAARNEEKSDLQIVMQDKDQLLEEFSFLKKLIGIDDVTYALINGVSVSSAKNSLKQRFQFNGKIAQVVSRIDMTKTIVNEQVDMLVKNLSTLTVQEQEKRLYDLKVAINDFRRKLVSLASIAVIIKKRYFL